MGLNIYLTKYRIYQGETPEQAVRAGRYVEIIKDREENPQMYSDAPLIEWSGLPEAEIVADIPHSVMVKTAKSYGTRYCSWDKQKSYPIHGVGREIACWHKTFGLHQWFLKNVVGGEEDGKAHLVSKEQLEKLLDEIGIIVDGPSWMRDKDSCLYERDGLSEEDQIEVLKAVKRRLKGILRTDFSKWAIAYQQG